MRNGAHIVDVCLQSTDRDEINDIPPFYDQLIRKIKAPIMIDTTDRGAVELALTYCQGKSIINSVNLEDGEEKFERVCPIARAYGAALIVGTIDEDKRRRRRSRASASWRWPSAPCELLTAKYGIPPEDIIIDPLVFPCATGDENYIGGAVETIEAVRLIKERLPQAQDRPRHFERLVRPAGGGARGGQLRLPLLRDQGGAGPGDRERGEARALRLHSGRGAPPGRARCSSTRRPPMAPRNCAGARRTGASRPASRRSPSTSSTSRPSPTIFARPARKRSPVRRHLPLDERLANYIIEGTKDGLIADLDRKRAEGAGAARHHQRPADGRHGEVGRLFNNNELIVAEVLQSAEAMKAAVTHLEQFMEKADSASRGQDHPGHREGRRPRHRQEPGGDHPRQQRLPE